MSDPDWLAAHLATIEPEWHPLVVRLVDGTYRTWPGNVEVVPGPGAPFPDWAERFVGPVTYTHDVYREDRTPDELRCPPLRDDGTPAEPWDNDRIYER